MIKKRDFVLYGKKVGVVVYTTDRGWRMGTEITKENRVLEIQYADGQKKMIWEYEATKLDKNKFKKHK